MFTRPLNIIHIQEFGRDCTASVCNKETAKLLYNAVFYNLLVILRIIVFTILLARIDDLSANEDKM